MLLDLNKIITPEKPAIIWKAGRAFGDHLLAYLFSLTLNDNGISSVYRRRAWIGQLTDSPTCNWEKLKAEGSIYFAFRYWPYDKISNVKNIEQYKGSNIIQSAYEQFIKLFHLKLYNIPKKLDIKRNFIPVKFKELNNIPEIDIVMGTTSGYFNYYRNWPYFSELKKELDKLKISYIDLDEKNIKGIECLNYVKKCKLYIGLETGMSHYVSQFANGKTLIIQSGFVDFNFWCFYNYDHIEFNLPCSNCYDLNCKDNNICMKNISVDMVLNKIVEKLNKK